MKNKAFFYYKNSKGKYIFVYDDSVWDKADMNYYWIQNNMGKKFNGMNSYVIPKSRFKTK